MVKKLLVSKGITSLSVCCGLPQGFVSNRNSATEGVDPMETLLYSVFVANSESIGIGNLARVLNVDAREVRGAMSFACRLGFASRISTETSQGTYITVRDGIEASHLRCTSWAR